MPSSYHMELKILIEVRCTDSIPVGEKVDDSVCYACILMCRFHTIYACGKNFVRLYYFIFSK